MALHKKFSRHPLCMKPLFSIMVHLKNNKDNNLCNPVQNLFKNGHPIFTMITEQNTIYWNANYTHFKTWQERFH